jgi:hypothetical protein
MQALNQALNQTTAVKSGAAERQAFGHNIN